MTLLLPTSLGAGWPRYKRPTTSTRVAAAVSGREVTAALSAYPLFEFELPFEALLSGPAQGGFPANALQTLMGIYLQCQGQAGRFLYLDPSDCQATGQLLGAGNGTAQAFTFIHSIGGYGWPVGQVEPSGVNVYLNGTVQTSGWSITLPNTLVFAAAPSAGVQVTADYSHYYLCRFIDDVQEFQQMMAGIWTMSSFKFRSVKP